MNILDYIKENVLNALRSQTNLKDNAKNSILTRGRKRIVGYKALLLLKEINLVI